MGEFLQITVLIVVFVFFIGMHALHDCGGMEGIITAAVA
jgi:succinate-acetate transporter protein